MTPSNFVEIPKDLFARMLAALEDPESLTKQEYIELLEDCDQWYPYEADGEEEWSKKELRTAYPWAHDGYSDIAR